MLKILLNKSLAINLTSASESNIINRVSSNSKIDRVKKYFSEKNQNRKTARFKILVRPVNQDFSLSL